MKWRRISLPRDSPRGRCQVCPKSALWIAEDGRRYCNEHAWGEYRPTGNDQLIRRAQ